MNGNPNRSNFRDVSTSFAFVAGDDYSTNAKSIIAALANWTIYVQKITVGVTTDNAATQTFEDTANTPVPIGKTKASPGLGPITFDFGEEGIALTEAKGLEMKSSAAGMAASVTVTAYARKTVVDYVSPGHVNN